MKELTDSWQRPDVENLLLVSRYRLIPQVLLSKAGTPANSNYKFIHMTSSLRDLWHGNSLMSKSCVEISANTPGAF